MKALALVALVSFGALAADPVDVPLAAADPIEATKIVDIGETFTLTGPALVLPARDAVAVAQRLRMAEAERDALKTEVSKQLPGWVLPLTVALGVVAGGVVGFGVGYAVAHPK